MEYKICPILKAGKTYLEQLPYMEEIVKRTAKCIGAKCQWFEHGCPAFPVTKELREKLISKSFPK